MVACVTASPRHCTLLVFVAAACANSDIAKPRALSSFKSKEQPRVQQLAAQQLRQHTELEKVADAAGEEARRAASDAEEEAAAMQRDLQAEMAEARHKRTAVNLERMAAQAHGGALDERHQSGVLSDIAKPRLLSRPKKQESQVQQLRARGVAMVDRANRLRGGGLGELYQSGVLTAVATPAAASASALAVLLARAGRWHRPSALTSQASLALGSALVLGASLTMQGETATTAVLVGACTLLGGAFALLSGAATEAEGGDERVSAGRVTPAACALALCLAAPALLVLLQEPGTRLAEAAAAATVKVAVRGKLRGKVAEAVACSPLDGMRCAMQLAAQPLAAVGAGCAQVVLLHELARNATAAQAAEAAGAPLRFVAPLVAAVALARSPAELALVAWLGGAGALSHAVFGAGGRAVAPAVLGGALGAASVASLLPLETAASWQLWACHALASLAACAHPASPPRVETAAAKGSVAESQETTGRRKGSDAQNTPRRPPREQSARHDRGRRRRGERRRRRGGEARKCSGLQPRWWRRKMRQKGCNKWQERRKSGASAADGRRRGRTRDTEEPPSRRRRRYRENHRRRTQRRK